MKKLFCAVAGILLFNAFASSQLMVLKPLGKKGKNYGIGFGVFGSLDIPIITENQSIRIDIGEMNFFGAKGEGIFTSNSGIGVAAFKAGYKYVFSESQVGLYVLPTVGYGAVIVAMEEEIDAKTYGGLAAAMEAGYSIAVGQNSQLINLGLKYEYDFGRQGVSLQTIGFKVSYSFGFFSRNRY